MALKKTSKVFFVQGHQASNKKVTTKLTMRQNRRAKPIAAYTGVNPWTNCTNKVNSRRKTV